MAEGKKSRKFGRNSKRPSNVRYRTESRMDKNKRLNIEAAADHEVEAVRKMEYRIANGKPTRGTARSKRRAHMTMGSNNMLPIWVGVVASTGSTGSTESAVIL